MVRWVGLLVVLVCSSVALPAHAIFHKNRIVEVFPGTLGSPNAQYVELQMAAAGEGTVTGLQLTLYDASGTLVATSTFTSDLADATSQARFLVATTEAQTLFAIQADLTLVGTIPLAGGMLCYSSGVDCVAWGNYSGSTTDVGTPFNAALGLVAGQSMQRRLDIAGAPDTLDLEDDTDDCANDFVFATPSWGVNNAGTVGTPSTEGTGGAGGAAGAAGDNAGAEAGLPGAAGVPGAGGGAGDGVAGEAGEAGAGGQAGAGVPSSGGFAGGGMTSLGGGPTGRGGSGSGGLTGSGGTGGSGATGSAGKAAGGRSSSAGGASAGGRGGVSSTSGGKGGSPSAGHAGTSPVAPPADSGGCGCTVPARRSSTPAAFGLAFALGLLLRRTRRSR